MTGDLIWLLVCGALAAGEAAGFALARFGACWPVAAFLTAGTALAGCGWRVRGWPFAGVFLGGFTLALAASAERNAFLDAALACAGGRPVSLEVVVAAPPRARGGRDGAVRLSVPATAGPLEIRAVLPPPSGGVAPRPGERWLFTGRCPGATRGCSG